MASPHRTAPSSGRYDVKLVVIHLGYEPDHPQVKEASQKLADALTKNWELVSTVTCGEYQSKIVYTLKKWVEGG